jgi:hypothetical protein
MSRDPLRVPDYLDHILEAIRRIQKYCEGIDQTAFLKNHLVQDAVIRNFEIIGEASRNIERIDPQFLVSHLELPLICLRHAQWTDLWLSADFKPAKWAS